jgi:hypothetical protein
MAPEGNLLHRRLQVLRPKTHAPGSELAKNGFACLENGVGDACGRVGAAGHRRWRQQTVAKLDRHVLQAHAKPRSRSLTDDGVGARPDLMRSRFHSHLRVRRHTHARGRRRNMGRVGCHGSSPPHQPIAIAHGPNLRVTPGPTECRSCLVETLHQGAARIGQTNDGRPRGIIDAPQLNEWQAPGKRGAQKEWADFVTRRIREDVAVSQELVGCQSLADLQDVYCNYLRKAVDE